MTALRACRASLMASAVFAFMNLSMGIAATAEVGEASTTASAHYYVMPKGDHLPARAPQAARPVPLGYAIPNSQIQSLKKRGGFPSTGEMAPEPAVGSPQGPVVIKTCTTNSADIFTPSDINGAVSPSRIVVVTNDAVGVYRRLDCTTLSRVSLEDFFRTTFSLPQSQGVFDPRVLYDPSIQRFFISAESADDFNFDQFQYIAVSTDSNATSWIQYQIVLSKDRNVFCKQRRKGFWDYPSAGYNASRWFITANDFPTGAPEGDSPRTFANLAPRAALLSIDKAPTLTAGDITVKCFNDLRFNLAPPIVLGGGTKSYFLSPGGSGQGDTITRYKLDSGSTDPLLDRLTTTRSINVRSWTLGPNAPQPNGQTLDVLDGRFQSASIQAGGALWNVHTINIGGFARWRLYKFSTTETDPLFTLTPSSVADQNDFLFNPSVATRSDASSDPAFVTFSRTIPSLHNPNGYAAMLIAKGPNASRKGWSSTLISKSLDQYEETGLFASSTPCNESDIRTCRWGDYSATQIDPVDTSHAFGFNQLIIGVTSKNWTTKGSEVR